MRGRRAALAGGLALASGLALLSCRAPATPALTAPGPAPATEVPPATWALAIEYRPALAVRVQKNGAPWGGEVDVEGAIDGGPLRVRLRAEGGVMAIPESDSRLLQGTSGVWLLVEGTRVALPRPGQTNPFACALSLGAVAALDPCRDPLPEASGAPESCDQLGQQAWREALAGRAAQADGCWGSLDEATVGRLRALGHAPLRAAACERLMRLPLADAPAGPLRAAARLCQRVLDGEGRQRAEQALLRVDLEPSFERVQQGSTWQMLDFFTAYRALAPARAEAIRQLAARRFGPKNPKIWLAHRDAIERVDAGSGWRATLCDHDRTSAQLAVASGAPPRFSASSPLPLDRAGAPPLSLGAGGAGPPVLASPGDPLSGMYREEQADRRRLVRRVAAVARGRLGVSEVTVEGQCSRGFHWYFSDFLKIDEPAELHRKQRCRCLGEPQR